MKPLSDLLQILLSLPGPFGYIAALLLVLLAWQALKSIGEILAGAWWCLKWLRGRLLRLTWPRLAMYGLLALPVFFLRFTVIDQLQYLEYVFAPAYVVGDTSAHTLAIYEAELSKRCDTYEAEIVKRRTREIAAKVGTTPLSIYEVAYSECGLNPFQVRTDGIAAGWIQFTRAGVAGIATMEEVKAACQRRDIEKMMDWTEVYLARAAAGRPLGDATGVYTAVFAPGFIGAADATVLYAGFENPAYALNDCLDGYYTKQAADGRQQIFRSRGMCDGKITVGDLRLHLEAKKSRLLAKHLPN